MKKGTIVNVNTKCTKQKHILPLSEQTTYSKQIGKKYSDGGEGGGGGINKTKEYNLRTNDMYVNHRKPEILNTSHSNGNKGGHISYFNLELKTCSNQDKKWMNRRRRKPKLRKGDINILYANANGLRSKMSSLQVASKLNESHIILITETKGKPPKMEGYEWHDKPRTQKGGGVGIAIKNEIYKYTKLVTEIEDTNQEVIWIELSVPKNETYFIGVYYGKQEDEMRDAIYQEFAQLKTQVIKLRKKGRIVLAGDFNAKLEINKNDCVQTISRNGKILEEFIKDLDLDPVTLNSETGIWTRVNRKNPTERSVIDYILMDKKTSKEASDIIVDEEGIYRLKSKDTHSDHNSLLAKIPYQPHAKYKTIKRWKLGNKKGWKEFNEQIVEKTKDLQYDDHDKLQKTMVKVLQDTVGQVTITIGKGKVKKSPLITQLRKDNKEAKKAFEQTDGSNKEDKRNSLERYYNTQTKLKEQIQNEEKNEVTRNLQEIAKEGGVKSNLFWKTRKKILRKPREEYDLITEDGQTLCDPDEAKEYTANFFENLYQAREGTIEHQETTNRINTEIKEIEEEMRNKPAPSPITLKEMKETRKKLKRFKSTGPDHIPNEVFIEATDETLSIFKGYFNHIIQNDDTPPNWQVGKIITFYKGKGTKGMCSNERGITISSNTGKYFERVVNNRVKEEVQMSEAQAGGQEGSATTDHIITVKELIKLSKKRLWIVYLDVTKAYDKAWADGIMHVMYKQGLKSKMWLVVKRLNENLTARVETKHGLTRTIKIKDSIRQGGVLSVVQYALLMDEIGKNIQSENLGIKISENNKIGNLLWMDDVLMITDKEREMQRMLDITNETSEPYRIKYGQAKSQAQAIGNVEKVEYKIGDMPLQYTETYKYLGHIQNEKNNLADHLSDIKGKVECAYQTLMAIAGNKYFKGIELESVWEMIGSCVTSIITYSMEACNQTKAEMKILNRMYDNILTRILMVPPTTPRELLYIETGLLDIETIIEKNRLNYNNRVANSGKTKLKETLQNNQKGSWRERTEAMKKRLGITEEDHEGSKDRVKKNIGKKVEKNFQEKLKEAGKDKSKVKYFLENKKEWKVKTRAKYMNKMNRVEVSTIFKARSRMLEIKNNYKNMHRNRNCRLCGLQEEDQTHVLEECTALTRLQLEPVRRSEFFSDDIKTLKLSVERIQNIMAKLETA